MVKLLLAKDGVDLDSKDAEVKTLLSCAIVSEADPQSC